MTIAPLLNSNSFPDIADNRADSLASRREPEFDGLHLDDAVFFETERKQGAVNHEQ